MEFITYYTLEHFILDTKWDDFPEEVQKRAIVCGIDLTTALLLGSKGQQFQAGLRMARDHFKAGDIPVIGSSETFNIWGAAVAMAHASNSFDIDDGHNMIKGHPGTSFVGGVLAAALDKDISLREYLTTLVVCYEAAIRCGLALQDYYKFLHSTGAYGAFGTAAGMGRILRLSPQQLNNALSVADFHAPLTPVMRAVEYPSMNKDGVPFGVLVGVGAVLETLAGTTGCGYLLEMPQYRELINSIGSRYEIMNLYFKPFTCCRWAHQPISACIDLMCEHNFSAEDVEQVCVHTFDSAARLSKKVPTTTDEAQYNIAWPVASSLVFGDVGIDQVIESALDNPQVLDMMQRLVFVVDPEMEVQFPEKRLAWVEIKLKDGNTFKSQVYAAPGEHTDHVDIEWITNKFHRRNASILTPGQQNQLLTMLECDLDISIRFLVATINQMLGISD